MKKGMKKLLAVIMIMVLAAGALAACGGDTDNDADDGKTVKIGLIQLMEHPSLNTIRESIIEGLGFSLWSILRSIQYAKA